MSKGFTPDEKASISIALIEAFEAELRYQKINKISIDDLVRKVGISKGSFYNFFPSKEILFFHVINNIQQKMVSEIMAIANKKQQSSKNKLKHILILVVEKLQSHPWIRELDGGEFKNALRKLPQDLKKSLTSQDIVDVQNILLQLNLESTIPVTRLVAIIQIILSSATKANDIGKQYNMAIKTLVDLLVNNLFEDR